MWGRKKKKAATAAADAESTAGTEGASEVPAPEADAAADAKSSAGSPPPPPKVPSAPSRAVSSKSKVPGKLVMPPLPPLPDDKAGVPQKKMKTTKSQMQEDVIRLHESQILNCSRECKDRILLLHDTVKSKTDSTFKQMMDSEDENARIKLKEVIVQLKVLTSRLELGIYDSHLMIELCQYLQHYDLVLGQGKDETRKTVLENARLRDQINLLMDDALKKEGSMALMHEDMCFWEFMANSAHIEMNSTGQELSYNEIFRGLVRPNDFNNRDHLYCMNEPEMSLFQEVRRLMANNNISQAIRHVNAYLRLAKLPKTKEVGHILLAMSNYCCDAEMYNDASDACTNALSIFISMDGETDEYVVKVLCKMAYFKVCEGKWKEAIDRLIDAVTRLTDDNPGEINDITISLIYLAIGYCIFRDNEEAHFGLTMMELACGSLELKLPDAESRWVLCCLSFTKTLNKLKYYSAALYVTCEVAQYLYENRDISLEKAVYEIAFKQDHMELTCNEIDIPVGFKMDLMYQEIMGEMRWAFSGLERFSACHLIDSFLDDVRNHDPSVIITESELKHQLQRIASFKDKETAGRATTVFGSAPGASTKKKKPFNCSAPLMQFMKDSDQGVEMPLEFKTATRNKRIDHGLKLLANKLKSSKYAKSSKEFSSRVFVEQKRKKDKEKEKK